MAFVYRIVILFLFVSLNAQAVLPLQTVTVLRNYKNAPSSCSGAVYSDLQGKTEGQTVYRTEICNSLGWTDVTGGIVIASSACSVGRSCNSGLYFSSHLKTVQQCPQNSHPEGANCACDSGYHEENNSCVEGCLSGQTLNPFTGECQTSCPSGPISASGQYANLTITSGGGLPKLCLGGCEVITDICGIAGTNSVCLVGNANGEFCNPATTYAGPSVPDTELSPEAQCVANGQSYGYLNGSVVCVAKTESSQPVTEVKETDNPDGTKTQTSTTTNPDGTVETTTSTVTTGGTLSGTQTTSEPLAAFCQSNPDLTICKNSGVSGGNDCNTPPVCSGDAVACSQLFQTWKLRCDGINQDLIDSGNEAINDGDNGNTEKANPLTTSISVTSDKFLGAGSCPSDLSISAAGHNVTIPFSNMCGTLELLGNILVALAAFASTRIIFV